MKKIVALLLLCSLLMSDLSVSLAAEKTYAKKQITIQYGGKEICANVLMDEDGILYAPNDWMTYFGLYDYQETEEDYVYFPPSQKEDKLFAKRIYFSKDGKEYKLCIYRETVETREESDSKQKKIWERNLMNLEVVGRYEPILQGTFSKSFYEKDKLYLPIAEMLPFLNAKVGMTDSGNLYISPNSMSLTEALYDVDVNKLMFDATRDMKGSKFISYTAYVVDTFMGGIRFDRILGKGKENDYKTIFREYLIDSKTYLSAFDATPSPSAKMLEDSRNKSSVVETAADLLDEDVKMLEYMCDIKELPAKSKSFSGTFKDIMAVDVGDIAEGAYKIFDYWYHYANQIDDHRKMLEAVYSYPEEIKEIAKELGFPSYKAAEKVQKQYGEDTSDRLLAVTEDVAWDLGTKVVEKTADYAMGNPILPYSAAHAVASLLVPQYRDAVKQVENDALLYVIDECTCYSKSIYWAMYNSNQYDIQSLENMRLCMMMLLISSKHAYTSLWGKDYRHPKISQIEEVLEKIYLSADGVECESIDYYGKKSSELKKSLKKIKTKDGWSDSNNRTLLVDCLEMSMKDITRLYGEDYEYYEEYDVIRLDYRDGEERILFELFGEGTPVCSLISVEEPGKGELVYLTENVTNKDKLNEVQSKLKGGEIYKDSGTTSYRFYDELYIIDFIWFSSSTNRPADVIYISSGGYGLD